MAMSSRTDDVHHRFPPPPDLAAALMFVIGRR
jgi:hypothetical protein